MCNAVLIACLVAAGPGSAAFGQDAFDPLAGAYSGKLSTHKAYRGWYSIQFPSRWTPEEKPGGTLLLHPHRPVESGDHFPVALAFEHLPAEKLGLDAAALFARGEEELRTALEPLGIHLLEARFDASPVEVAGLPGVVRAWEASRNEGAAVVWSGSLLAGDYQIFLLAVFPVDEEFNLLPGVKRVFGSLRVSIPERNPDAEQAIAGASFFYSQMYSGGSSHVVYDFSGDGQVKQTTMMSGPVGLGADVGGESSRWGSFEIHGDRIYIWFSDEELEAQLVVEDNSIVALRSGERLYRRR